MTNLSLGTRLLQPRMSLPTLVHSMHSPIYSPQWILYCQYTIKGHCLHVPLSRWCYWGSQIQCIRLHRVEATWIIGKHEPSGVLLGKRSSHAWVGGLCNKHRTLNLCQIRKDIVIRELKKEGIEMAELSQRKVDSSFDWNRWLSRCWTLLGLHMRLNQQHLELKRWEKWRSDVAGLGSNDLLWNTGIQWDEMENLNLR